MTSDALDMNLVRQAQREGRLEQMWWMLQGIAESGHVDLSLQALRFVQGLQPFDLARSLPVFDRLSGLTSPDVRSALLNTMSRLAAREPAARTQLFERLLDYSRGWDRVGERLSASGATRISGLWLKFSLFEKIILRALGTTLGAGLPGPRSLREIAGSLTIFEPLLPEIELRLKLDGFAESGLLTRDAEGRYQIADDNDRRHIEHFGDILHLIHEHSAQFVDMVTFENFRGLQSALKRNKQVPMNRWLEVFGLDTHVWKNREEFIGMLQDWRGVVEAGAGSKETSRAAETCAAGLAGRIRFEIQRNGLSEDFHYFSGRKLGLRNPRLSQLTLLLPRRADPDAAALKRLDEWILRESLTQQIFVLLYPWVDRSRLREEADASGHDLVLLEERHLFKLAFAPDQDAAFMRTVLEGCDLESLSPYEAQAPVREMFYGREGLVKEILRSTKGYALVGTRRLGKTSLLFRLQDEIKKRPHAETVFLECGGVTGALTMAERLAVALRLNLPHPFELADFERALRRHLAGEHRMLYCFFDEIDDLVAAGKESEPIWQIFKSLSFEGRMTVYVAGFSELFARFRDYESLFFNFLIFRRMSYLDRQSAFALISNPVQELGLHFEDPETQVSAILEKTSTHPNIIQIFCDLLVKRMARRRRRTILASDIEETAREPEFEEAIVRIMHSNLIRPVEKLLLLLVAYYNLRPISSAQVADLLADWQVQIPIGEIVGILDRLVLYAVFEEREGQYDFAHPYFAAILQHRDVESMITYYCDEVAREQERGDGRR